MSHTHNLYDSDMRFLIDPSTRSIKNQSKKTIIVRGDHNSERFTFEMPRMIEGHDMSTCDIVQIHYLNIDSSNTKYEGLYTVDDMQISSEDDQIVLFSWLISRNASRSVGNLNFIVRFMCTAADGTVDYAWSTTIHKEISVSETINNTETVVEKYADVIAEWEARIIALEQNGGGSGGSIDVDLTDYVTKDEMPEINVDDVVSKVPASSNVYPAYTADKWTDNYINGGFVVDDENYCYSPNITVKPNTSHSMTHKPYNVIDNNGVEISITESIDMESGGSTYVIYTPSNCSQISITIDKREFGDTTDINTAVENFNSVFMLVEGNTLPTEFESYVEGGYRLNDNVEIPNLPEGGNITPEQTTFFDESVTVSGNLLDITTKQVGLLHTNDTIYTSADNTSYEAYRYFENYMPVDEGDEISVQFTDISNGVRYSTANEMSGIARVVAYDSNKQVLASLGASIGGGASPIYVYTVPKTVAYIRITLTASCEYWTEISVVKNATSILPYEEYGEIKEYQLKPEFIPDIDVENITPEQTTFFANEIVVTSNLLDVTTKQTGLLDVTGKIHTGGSYDSYRYFDQYISVDEGDEISVQFTRDGIRYTSVNKAYSFHRVVAYDSNKQVLQTLGVKTTADNTVYMYKVPATVAYIRLTLSATFDQITDVAIVKNTSDVIPYEEYGEKRQLFLKEEYLREEKEEVLAFLPDEIVCAVGRTIEIYNKQVCPIAEKYHFRWICAVGKALERKFSITGTEALIGDYELTLEIYDDTETWVYTRTITLRIVSNTLSNNISICPIGDSLTNAKPWLNEVRTLSDNKVSFVGTRGTVEGIKHEGRSGFTSTGYLTAHDYEFENEGVHPFWDTANECFSWNYYKTSSGINPDAVQIFLGTNDLFNVGTGETLASNIKTIVDNIRSTDTDMPIFIVLTILVGSQNGLGKQENTDGFAMYKGKYKYGLDCKFIKAMKLLYNTLKDYTNLYFVPLTECHDNEYNFGAVETPVNPRATQTEPMPNEGIHPQQQGYEQMADVMYSVYCRTFNN